MCLITRITEESRVNVFWIQEICLLDPVEPEEGEGEYKDGKKTVFATLGVKTTKQDDQFGIIIANLSEPIHFYKSEEILDKNNWISNLWENLSKKPSSRRIRISDNERTIIIHFDDPTVHISERTKYLCPLDVTDYDVWPSDSEKNDILKELDSQKFS